MGLDLSQAEADALPASVRGTASGTSLLLTEVFVYGPPATTRDSVSVDGRVSRTISTEIDDLGRPVAVFETFLGPGETAKVVATFRGLGEFGPVDVRTSPMAKPTSVEITGACG